MYYYLFQLIHGWPLRQPSGHDDVTTVTSHPSPLSLPRDENDEIVLDRPGDIVTSYPAGWAALWNNQL